METFKAKTEEGYTIKILIELLQNIIKSASFHLTSKGIFLKAMDSQRKVFIDIELNAENFNSYYIKKERIIGVTLSHFYKMLKTIKKKDTLMLFIEEDNDDKLFIEINPPKNTDHKSVSAIQIQNLQCIDIEFDQQYEHPVLISSSDYQRTFKDMNNISDTLTVSKYKHHVTFSCISENIFSKHVRFGENNDMSVLYFNDDFYMEPFIRTLKITGLNKNVQLYGKKNLPLLIKTRTGQLGTICIYVKSKTQIDSN